MKKSGKVRLSVAVGITVLVIIGVPILFLVFFSSSLTSRISELDKQAALLGLPLTAQDMDKLTAIPAGENSASMLSKIFALGKQDIPPKSEPLLARYAPNGDIKDKSEGIKQFIKDQAQLVQKCEPLFALLPAALSKPYCSFTKDWSNPTEAIFPEYAQFREISKLMTVKIQVDLDQGNEKQAVKDFREDFSLANITGTDPTVIGALVATSETSESISIGRSIFLKNLRSPQTLQQLANVVKASAPINFANLIKGETYFNLYSIDHANELPPGYFNGFSDQSRPTWTRFAYTRGLVREKVEKGLIQDYQLLVQNPENYPKVELAFKSNEPKFNDPSAMESTYLSFISATYQAVTKSETLKKAFIAVCDVAIYYNQHHKAPATLADAGFHDLNPLTNASYEYSPTPNGFHLVVMPAPTSESGADMAPSIHAIEERHSLQYSVSFN